MDEPHLLLEPCGHKFIILNMRDMSSGFKFDPLIREHMYGEDVAAYLEEQFSRFGQPLFLKMDNGPVLNDDAVAEVRRNHLVLPLNSPAYYPPYNGAMEHDQGEIKAALRAVVRDMPALEVEQVPAFANLAVHKLNRMPRRRLGGRNSEQHFYDRRGGPYHKRKRQEIFTRVLDMATQIHDAKDNADWRSLASAWRIAAEYWLVSYGSIEVRVGGKVLPYSCPSFSHN